MSTDMNAIVANTTFCTDNGTQVDFTDDGVVVRAPNGATVSYGGDGFSFGGDNGLQALQTQGDSHITPEPRKYGFEGPADHDDVAGVIQGYGNQSGTNGNTHAPTSGSSGSNSGSSSSSSSSDSAPGSNWAKKMDDLYAQLENNPNMSAEDMQKLQMKMQQAMQMFQLFTQMMTAMHEAKKDAGRQIRY